MVMSRVASWQPTFPDPSPRHWVCFTALAEGVDIVSDEPLKPDERAWLRRWLESHEPREADVEASYVYLGLATAWAAGAADGKVSPESVIGVGSGSDFGEPPGATLSTVGEIWNRTILTLQRDLP